MRRGKGCTIYKNGGKDKICGWKSRIKNNVYWGIIGMEVLEAVIKT